MANDSGKSSLPRGKGTAGPIVSAPTATELRGVYAGKADRPAHTRRAVSGEARQLMICEAAYYIAERRGFEAGRALDDWLLAEHQIEAALARDESRGKTS